MILEDETFKAFGYYPNELSYGSNRPIKATCDDCGTVREIRKSAYYPLCRSCSLKGRTFSEEHKANMSKNHADFRGEKHHNWKPKIECICETCGKCFPVWPSAVKSGIGSRYCSRSCAAKARKGKKNSFFGKTHTEEAKRRMSAAHFKCGKKESGQRHKAKRRKLGYVLIYPLVRGEVGHHVTNTFVIGVRGEVHVKFSGYSRKKHRRLVFQWLKANDTKKYEMVLSVL